MQGLGVKIGANDESEVGKTGSTAGGPSCTQKSLSCTLSVVMQNAPTGLNWPDYTDDADWMESSYLFYYLSFKL